MVFYYYLNLYLFAELLDLVPNFQLFYLYYLLVTIFFEKKKRVNIRLFFLFFVVYLLELRPALLS